MGIYKNQSYRQRARYLPISGIVFRACCGKCATLFLIIVLTGILAGCAGYMAVLEESRRNAMNENHIRMQQTIHEANMRQQFR